MGRSVIIIGNSGAARECYWILHEMQQQQGDLHWKGFLSFEGYQGKLRDLAGMELGDDESYVPEKDDIFVIGVGKPELRKKIFDKWKARGAEFLTLTHPCNAGHPSGIEMGEGNIFAYGVFFSCNVRVGNANYFNTNAIVGHDACIGDANFFCPFTMVLGNVVIGSGNLLGAGAAVMPNTKIGDNNILAPGSYIYKGCGNNTRMVGNPALDYSGNTFSSL